MEVPNEVTAVMEECRLYENRQELVALPVPVAAVGGDAPDGVGLAVLMALQFHIVSQVPDCGDLQHSYCPRVSLNKLYIGIKSSLEIITSDSAHVLGDDTADLPGLNVGNQPFPVWTLKIAPGPSIVRVVDTICKTSLGRIALQQHFGGERFKR